MIDLRQTYTNPFVLEQEWPDYGIGDPYILRFDGKYYLYCSTKDRRVGIKAWSSDDLVNWHYEGLVTEEPISVSAYAPEVAYWNGSFYMYTSPAGKGHYVLQSDKPTGPFVKKTENLGLSIDGSVFIDDDGTWTFTHAALGGIMASTMTDPYTMGTDKKLNASLGHWTEGSMIIKRNGRYFITYTGNHVFSKGYRVNYGVSRKSPMGPYTIPENNPILISTDPDFYGLGHSATVMGPDLDSYYIVYHNLVGRSAEGPPVRRLNLDRLVFNGDKMSVLGPTHRTPQEAPTLPVFRDDPGTAPSEAKWEHLQRPAGGEAYVSKAETSGTYTIEFNFKLDGGKGGGQPATLDSVFSYADPGHYRAARLDRVAKSLALIDCVNGKETVVAVKALPNDTDLTKLHTIRIESDRDGTHLYWDGLLKVEHSAMAAKQGRIGYFWPQGPAPEFHYTAFSNEAGGSSDRKTLKPLPGAMEAVHGIWDGAPGIRTEAAPDGSEAVVLAAKGNRISFPVNVSRDGTYLLSVNAAKASAGSTLVVQAGGATKTIKLEAKAFADDSVWTKVPLGKFELKKGKQRLVLQLEKGEIGLQYMEAGLTVPVPEHAVVTPSEVGTVNRFGGDSGWADYTASFDVTLKENPTDAGGVLLRTSNESEFKDQVKDAYMGYLLSFRTEGIALSRVSYETMKEKTSAPLVFKPGQTHRLTVKLKGATIEVYSDGGKKPILTWVDSNAFLLGRVGLRGSSAAWTISDITINGN